MTAGETDIAAFFLEPRLGAHAVGDGRCAIGVWAPSADSVRVRVGQGRSPRLIPLEPDPHGYHRGVIDDAPPGTRYAIVLPDGSELPDPASRSQPDGPHGSSAVVAPFEWKTERWVNPPLARHVIYELHVGTFTPEGTFDAVIPRLDDLAALSVTAIELMPVAEFPGARNWGYDGVALFAAHSAYGGIDGLRRLVDAAHARGLCVVLDVVYNHLGPEGNYLGRFGPYFTERYKTPWGAALNFSEEHSDHVRRFFIQNAIHWTIDCRIDMLRLDAVHAIIDPTATTFLEELAAVVHGAAAAADRTVHLIAESGDNDPRLVTPRERNGIGMDASWNDDFHHAVHALLTGEQSGYYLDYPPRAECLAECLRNGFLYAGGRSEFRKRRHGRVPRGVPSDRFVVCIQNHDQIGNRMLGERLPEIVDASKPGRGHDAQRVAAALMLLSPFVPLLFMGEEHADPSPFQFFVSHTDPGLVEAVRKGRAAEFSGFAWKGEAPDPQSEATFERSRIDWSLRGRAGSAHGSMHALYAALLRIRRDHPALQDPDRAAMDVWAVPGSAALAMIRRHGPARLLGLFNFGETPVTIDDPRLRADWSPLLSTTDAPGGPPTRGGGPPFALPPFAALVFDHTAPPARGAKPPPAQATP